MTTRLKIDPTTRYRCGTHGDAPATYVGRERYECWHCATAAGVVAVLDLLPPLRELPDDQAPVEPVDLGHPADCDCPFCY